MDKNSILFVLTTIIIKASLSNASPANFQVVHFLDPSHADTIYYSSWNSDQWVKWLRDKYDQEADERRTSEDGNILSDKKPPSFKGSWVHIVIPATQEDFNTAYASDSVHTYTDPQKSDYFWSDYAFPVYVILRSPNATLNITQEEAVNEEEQETRKRILYGYNVYNCAEKKMFVNAKLDPDTLEPIHFQTFFPKKVKNPKDKLRIPLSVCSKVSQTRGLLDEIRFQLGSSNVI